MQPPDYLEGKVKAPDFDGPASLFNDDRLAGKDGFGNRVFDVIFDDIDVFEIRWSGFDDEGYTVEPAYIEAKAQGSDEWFAIYDTRKHIASCWAWLDFANLTDEERKAAIQSDGICEKVANAPIPHELRSYKCEKCGNTMVKISPSFEVDVYAISNNDCGWFQLAVECVKCKLMSIIYDHETA